MNTLTNELRILIKRYNNVDNECSKFTTGEYYMEDEESAIELFKVRRAIYRYFYTRVKAICDKYKCAFDVDCDDVGICVDYDMWEINIDVYSINTIINHTSDVDGRDGAIFKEFKSLALASNTVERRTGIECLLANCGDNYYPETE